MAVRKLVWQKPVWRFIALTGVCLILALSIATILSVRHLDAQKQIELLATFISNLLGTVVGAGLAFWFALRQFSLQSDLEAGKKRIDTTFELHREIIEDLVKARTQADRLLKTHQKGKTLDVLQRELAEAEIYPILQVVFFYRRLQLAIDYNRVEDSLVPELFGEKFIWWYYVWFTSILLPLNWLSSKQMRRLQEWMERNSEESIYQQWVSEAHQARDERLSSINGLDN